MSERSEYNRVIWHSRRGMLELDLLLEPFVKLCYPTLDVTDQARYRSLLSCEDQQLFDWFLKKQPVDDGELSIIVDKILGYQKERLVADNK